MHSAYIGIWNQRDQTVIAGSWRQRQPLRQWRAAAVSVAVAALCAGMVGLFTAEPPGNPLIWFAAMLAIVFSSFSFLTICFYAQGVTKADFLGEQGHLQLARWRETGALLGICVASIAPVVLGRVMDAPFAGFAAGFAFLGLLAWRAMASEWVGSLRPNDGVWVVLSDRVARRLLIVAFLNAAPVAVSSTLFLFFVEARLDAPGWEGPLLLLFFMAAAVAAPIWGKAAERFGTRATLLAGMALSVLAFGFALTLGAGDVAAFAAICLASGAALGADMTLLPALFAARVARISAPAGAGFGLWSFLSIFSAGSLSQKKTLLADSLTPDALKGPALKNVLTTWSADWLDYSFIFNGLGVISER